MLTLVTGATGFLGEFVIRCLSRAGRPLAGFVRPTSDTVTLTALGVEIRTGDLADCDSLAQAMAGVETLVNLASLGFGHAPNLVRAAREAGVRRAVFIGTTAVFTTLPAKTKAARAEAERLIFESGLRWTLLRPTMIYGTPRDRNIWRLIQFLRRSPAMPVVGSGRHLQQPVYVADVAEAVARVLEVDATIGQAYDLPGAEPLTFVEVIDTLSRLLGRRIHKVFIPLWLGLAAARLSRSLPLGPRISPEQILRLEEDKAYDFDRARDDFGYRPLSFFDGAQREMGYLA